MGYWYKEEDLVSFGKFLLSDDRMKTRFESALSKGLELPDALEYIKEIYDADIANWKDEVGIKIKDDSTLFDSKEAETQDEIDDRFYNIAAKKIFAQKWQKAREILDLPRYKPEENIDTEGSCTYPECDCNEEDIVLEDLFKNLRKLFAMNPSENWVKITLH